MIFKLLTVLISMSMVSAVLNKRVLQSGRDDHAFDQLRTIINGNLFKDFQDDKECSNQQLTEKKEKKENEFHHGIDEAPELGFGIVICNETKENLQYYCDSVVKTEWILPEKYRNLNRIVRWDEPKKFEDENEIEHKCKKVRISAEDPNGSNSLTGEVLGVECPKSKSGRIFALIRSTEESCFIVCIKKEREFKPVGICAVRESSETVPEVIKTAPGESSEPVPEAIKTTPGE